MGSWNILNILSVGKTANSFDLPTNCYFCTASALQNTTCELLVAQMELMQYDTGKAENFKELFEDKIGQKTYFSTKDVMTDLGTLLPGNALALAYERSNGSGHMIVVFKASFKVSNDGSVSSPAGGHLRHIDYQTQNPQPYDGLFPASENLNAIVKCHLFYPE